MTTGWLIEESARRDVELALRAANTVNPGDFAAASARLAAQAAEARERGSGVSFSGPGGGVAVISVRGMLTASWNPMLEFFGVAHTPWPDIRASIAAAEADKNVQRVEFHVSSPGGMIDGMFDTLAAVQAMSKPRSTMAVRACSAAYALAAVVGNIKAASPAAEFGSIGILAEVRVDDSVIAITSTDAPNKRPDVKTEEGKATVRAYLDSIHALFAEAIASGRSTTVENVNATFGRGATLLAADAKARGMIDAVESSPLFSRSRRISAESATSEQTIAGARPGATTPRAESDSAPAPISPAPVVAAEAETPKATDEAAEETRMDLKTLKASHSDLYEAVKAEGSAQERKRCAAHVKMASHKGCADIAMKAIVDGTAFADDEVQAEYMSARMNARDVQNRQDDDAEAGKALDKAKQAPDDDLPLHAHAIDEFLKIKKGQ